MKALTLLLVLSLVANLGLGAYAWRIRGGTTTVTAPAAASDVSRASSARATGTGPASTRTAAAWEPLAARELPDVVRRLRALGVPPAVLRTIISAELHHRLAPRRAAILAEQPARGYWEGGVYGVIDPKLGIAWRQLHREQQEQLRQLLGPDATLPDEMGREMQRRRFGTLSPPQVEELERVAADYADLRMEIEMTTNGVHLPEDREKLGFLDREERADLAAVLSPHELLEYELRQSATAAKVRRLMVGFNASEEEFRQVFAAFRAVETSNVSGNYGHSVFNVSDSDRAAIRAQLEGRLSPERLADFDQLMDPNYAATNRMVARLQLPLSAAREVTAMRDDFTSRATAVRNNRQLDEAERNAQLLALQAEATAKVTRTLGENGVQMYRSYGGGWLDRIGQRPRRD